MYIPDDIQRDYSTCCICEERFQEIEGHSCDEDEVPSNNNLHTYKFEEIFNPNFRPRVHEINVNVPYQPEERPVEGEIAFFNVYVITRHYGGAEEGGWWYNFTDLAFTIPFIYGEEAVKLLIKSQEGRVTDLQGGNINSVLGGQEAFVCIEKQVGESDSEPATYE